MKMKLSPCPFCGKQPEAFVSTPYVEVFCGNAACPIKPNAFSNIHDSESESACFAKTVEKWNTRAPMEEQ